MGLLHHLRWGQRLQRWADGELDDTDVVRVSHHVARCPNCASQLDGIHRLKSALRRYGDRHPVDSAVDRLRTDALRLG